MKKDAVLKPDSLGPNKTEDLITRSDGLFIWARLSLDFISKHRNPEKALDFVLSDVSSSTTSDRHDHRQLDILYGTVLHDACKDGVDPGRESQENTELILRVLGSAVVARVPLSFANLSCLIADGSFDATEIVWAIERLGSVLPTHGDSQIVRVIHPSFIDFLTTKKRAQTFFIDTSDFNLSMCRASLQLMHRELKHDICAIGDASLLNTEIPTTKRRTLYEKRPLLYSCQFWGDHLADSESIVDDVVALVELFFMQHLLQWFEVLSLADALECALPALAKIEASFNELSRALADERRMTTISLGCRDATRFLRYHYSIIRLSALHAYISALAFTPSKSWIAQQYIPKYLPPLRVTVGVDHFWSPQVLIFDRHEWQVLAARFSPDKRNIASIDDYGTIHVWNTDSGHIFLTMSYPYLYDGCNTGSLSFSPDGKHLVTEIRGYPTLVWSTETGDKYERQLQERSGGPVSWSLDGRFIVSVDGDGHGMVWSGTTFEIIEKAFESLKGHGRIHRVEFSSDSKWLATAASDGSTHIRDVQTWDEIHRTMDATYSEGGERDFVALAFSPDRRKLAWFPGDRDKVTIWDIERDTISHLPIRHPDDGSEGRSLVFSPDGSTLVVGCESGLLTVRDVATGTILHDLKGHGVRVNGVEFANMASNTMLLSYSNDRTVRLWDVGTVNLSTGSSDEGPMSVHCSISADGRSLAAWDDDGPCFIWDTRTGTKLQLPYVSDGTRVNLAVFSPDRRRLAILDVNEELLFLWDVENRTALPCSIPADEVKAWAAAAICNLSVKVEPSLMSFSPDGPQQTHSSDMSQLVAIWTEAYDDGWIYAGTDSSRMRLCYLPALHRTSYEPFFPRKCMTGAGTHVATICIAAHFRLTILDLEGLLRMVPQSYRFLGEHAVNLPQLYSSMSDDATSALGKSCEDAGSHRPYLGMKYDFHGRE
ncbi:Vegetative incompatibility protein HET-E-1 [Grifola frondosa]|uniref:Vegetative incompatibility protein HET-E-1 n=1 Tax=Grifola frondosa TaxID=5627 RepID=A0A1C7LQ54_GRIFR|nr:Vegetative incompatibility protein HET-E-1 [Grifola frondosa]